MTNETSENATHPGQSSPRVQQNDEVARAVKRLYGSVNNVAQNLDAVAYIHTHTPDAQVIRDMVQKMYALVAISSGFLEDLMIESITGGEEHKDMWSKSHHERLLGSIEKCLDEFAAVGRAVRVADEQFQVHGITYGEGYLDGFYLDSQKRAQIALDECFDLVSRTKIIVKHTALARTQNLDTGEVQETLRLSRALRRPDLYAIWTLKDEPYASRRLRENLGLTQSTTSSSIGSSHIGPASYQQQSPVNLDHMEPSWKRADWPSAAATAHLRYAKFATTSGQASESEKKAPTGAPASETSESTPTRIPGENIALTPPPAPAPAEPGSVSFGEPSVIKPTGSGIPFSEKNLSDSPFTNWKPSHKPFSLSPHLEAYVVHPTVTTSNVASTVSYSIEPLRLAERDMQTQVRRLGPNYSIVDSLLNLHPQVSNLVRSQAVQRHGDLLSIQHGKPFSFAMSSGTLQITSVIFIVSTTTALPPHAPSLAGPGPFGTGPSLFGQGSSGQRLFGQGSSSSSQGQWPFNQGAFGQGAFGQGAFGQGAFGQGAFGQGAFGQGAFGQGAFGQGAFGQGAFGQRSSAQESSANSSLFEKAAPAPASASHLSSPEAYSKFLQDQGAEPCTHVEGHDGGLQHYQTITANKEWLNKNLSLEEIRLADYLTGRKYPPNTGPHPRETLSDIFTRNLENRQKVPLAHTANPPPSSNAWQTWTASKPSNAPDPEQSNEGRPGAATNNQADLGKTTSAPGIPIWSPNNPTSNSEPPKSFRPPVTKTSPFTQAAPATPASTAAPSSGLFGGASTHTSASPFAALGSNSKTNTSGAGIKYQSSLATLLAAGWNPPSSAYAPNPTLFGSSGWSQPAMSGESWKTTATSTSAQAGPPVPGEGLFKSTTKTPDLPPLFGKQPATASGSGPPSSRTPIFNSMSAESRTSSLRPLFHGSSELQEWQKKVSELEAKRVAESNTERKRQDEEMLLGLYAAQMSMQQKGADSSGVGGEDGSQGASNKE